MPGRRQDLWLFLAGVFFLGIAREFDRLLTNLRLREVGFSDAAIGRVIASHQVGMWLAALPVAYLLGRLPVRVVTGSSAFFAAGGLLLLGTAQQEVTAWLGEFLLGVSLAIPFVTSLPFILQRASLSRRTLWIGAVPVTHAVAGIVASPLAGWCATRFSFQGAFPTGAALALLALPAFAMIRERTVTARRSGGLGFLSGTQRLLLVNFLTGLGTGLCLPFLNLLLKDRAALDTLGIGAVFASAYLITAVFSLVATPYERKVGTRRGVMLGEGMIATLVLIMALAGQPHWIIAAVSLRGAAMALTYPLFKKTLMESVAEPDRRLMAGTSSFLWNTAMVLGGLAGGWLLEQAGYALLLGIASAAYYLCAVLMAPGSSPRPKSSR